MDVLDSDTLGLILGQLEQEELFNLRLMNSQWRDVIDNINYPTINTSQEFEDACKNKRYMSLLIHESMWKKLDLNSGLVGACIINNSRLVRKMIRCGASNYNKALSTAVKFNSMRATRVLLSETKLYLNEGLLFNASSNNNMDMVKLLLQYDRYDDLSLNRGLSGCCISGNIDIAKLMVEKGATNIEECCRGSALKGHSELYKYLQSKSGLADDEFFLVACCGPNAQLVAYISTKIRNPGWTLCLYNACSYSASLHLGVIKYIISQGADVGRVLQYQSLPGCAQLKDYLDSLEKY